MEISLSGAGKKFHREWIFRNVNLAIVPSKPLAILGKNGSGKSTLIQTLAGALLPSEGVVSFTHSEKIISANDVFSFVSLAAPYLELIEEFSLEEILEFHFNFKKLTNGNTVKDVLEKTGLREKRHSTFKYFSSGMKQRVKLSLAILSDCPILLLDEPCSNLDEAGVKWYQELLKNNMDHRTLVVASNNSEEEFFLCNDTIDMAELKP